MAAKKTKKTKKTVAKKARSAKKKAVAKKSRAKKQTPAKNKTAAKKRAAKKKAVAKKSAAKKAPVRKKAVAKKRAAKKVPVKRKAVTRKSAAKKKATAKQASKVDSTVVAESKGPNPQASSKPVLPTLAEGAVGVGDRVPEFALPDQDGNEVTSRSLLGRKYVLYFYPKDDTPGCTTEACGFRDELPRFASAGVEVVGVSPDKPAAHQRFRAKYDLPFTLLCDTEHLLSEALGVWALKNNYGREYMGIVRSSFLIDEAGKVREVWRKVRVAGHVPAVLEAAAAL